jgi:hypothetical protein
VWGKKRLGNCGEGWDCYDYQSKKKGSHSMQSTVWRMHSDYCLITIFAKPFSSLLSVFGQRLVDGTKYWVARAFGINK